MYDLIFDCPDYERAVNKQQQLYDKPENEIYAKYILSTRRQNLDEALDEYFLNLRRLSKDCNNKAVRAEKHRAETIRDPFISRLLSINIR